jgi:UDP-N-acetylglucosamine--N-acetylmuramyl-(pentapeptide) pyrophosphoryl-undecaprenol N-acetylglucosamine transferase
MSDRPVRIVIAGGGTGGHVQPAIAVADVLRSTASVDLTWIGSTAGVENQSAAQRGIPFKSIPTGKLRRYFSLYTFTDALRIPVGVVRARMLLRSIQPDVIFSTGGFVSVPTVVAGWLAGIPIITHEQTATVGLANRINARFADRIALAFEATSSLLENAADRIVVTGNPVRGELLQGDALRGRSRFRVPENVPLIYVTGGALGAQAINETVRTQISELVSFAAIVHQCGPAAGNGDYPRLLEARSRLPDLLQPRYIVQERIGDELADLYAAADLVIGRSGGGTVAELALLGKPSILIPLPGTASDEQTRNARTLEAAGAAVVIPQQELSPEKLTRTIHTLLDEPERRLAMAAAAKSVAQPEAAIRLTHEILALARRHQTGSHRAV